MLAYKVRLYSQQLTYIILDHSQYNYKHMATKNAKTGQLCSIPEVVPFEFREAQELYTEITMLNLIDSEITYKIKTNKPGLYLVKPMEGRIPRKDKIKVTFKRKQLALRDYHAILANDSVNKEKFLIEINSQVVDSMDVTQNLQQMAYLGVKFTAPTHAPVYPPVPHKSPKANDNKNLQKILAERKRQLQQQIKIKESLQLSSLKPCSSRNQFTLQDLINVLIVAFLLGFII